MRMAQRGHAEGKLRRKTGERNREAGVERDIQPGFAKLLIRSPFHSGRKIRLLRDARTRSYDPNGKDDEGPLAGDLSP